MKRLHRATELNSINQEIEHLDLTQGTENPRLTTARLLRERDKLQAENEEMRRTFGSHPLFKEKDRQISTLRASNQRLREALEDCAAGLDAGLNSGDAVGAGNAMDSALIHARAALKGKE